MMRSRWAVVLRLAALVGLPWSEALALPEGGSPTVGSPVAVPTICGDIVTYANQDLEHNWLFTAKEAYQCLTSVPFLDAVALRYIDYYNTTLQFQSTLAYLKDPPNSYQQPSVNVQESLEEIRRNVTAGSYANQYDFEVALYSLVQRMHDSHVTLNSGVLSAFTFGSPYSIMSISTDGRQTPKVYIRDDIVASRSQGWNPSAISSINGVNANQYLQRFASINAVGMLEPHADWNQLMYSPVQDVLGTYNLFGWNTVLYPGDNLTFGFENGSIVTTAWLAYYENLEPTGPLTTGGDFYNYFVLGFLPASYDAAQYRKSPNSTNTLNGTSSGPFASWNVVSPAYPSNPNIVQPGLSVGGSGGILTGYFLNDISTAVLSIPNFDDYGTAADSFSNTTAQFIQAAKAAGLTRVVIDLQQNYGGDTLLAFDTFQQFFPNTEPFSGSRRRTHYLGDVLGGSITSFWNGLSAPNSQYNYTKYYFPMAANEWVIADRLNAATGQNFTSWSQYRGPQDFQGDQFSLTERYNLSNIAFDLDASNGFVPTQVSGQPSPWSAQDIILLTDSVCGSTCSLFVEMMSHQAGVRTVVVGGEPRDGPMQAASGSRGARYYSADDLDANMRFAGSVNQTANTTLPQVREQAIYTLEMGFNLRDQIRQNDNIPLQFKYEAADCRIYYTFANAYNMSRIWRDAASAIWTDPSLCVVGSTGYSTTGNKTPSQQPPSSTAQAPRYGDLYSNIKAQNPFGFGLGISDGFGTRYSDAFGPCNSNCANGCEYAQCSNGVSDYICTPPCDNPGGSCANGEGVCENAVEVETKGNTVDGNAESTQWIGTCLPASSVACPWTGGDAVPP